MTLFETTGAPERLQFFDGQRLFATDLQGLEEFHRQMRWLHNSSLHEPGIGNGFAVRGEEDDREVRVGPGYAIDDLGREIVLVQETVLQVPAVAGGADGTPVRYDLTVSYRGDDFLEEAEERRGLCGTRGVVRLREEPVFCWVELGPDLQPVDLTRKTQILSGRSIVLGRAEILACKLRSRLSTVPRFDARPPALPHIACGRVDDPEWRAFDEKQEAIPLADLCERPVETGATRSVLADTASVVELACLRLLPMELTLEVDTSCAGFRVAPCYSARIVGERLLRSEAQDGGRDVPVAFCDALLWTEEAESRPDGFTLRMIPIVSAFTGRLANGGLLAAACKVILTWDVLWQGVEG